MASAFGLASPGFLTAGQWDTFLQTGLDKGSLKLWSSCWLGGGLAPGDSEHR